MENTKQKVEMTAHEIEAPKPHDDRYDLVEIVYGEHPSVYRSEMVNKIDAFRILYEYYQDSSSPMVPRNYPTDRGLREKSGAKINNATIYTKMRFKDIGSGVMTEVVKDCPLWIAVERAVSHKHHVEVIPKYEHDAFYAKRDWDQNEWRRQAKAEQERLNEMTGVISRDVVANNKI